MQDPLGVVPAPLQDEVLLRLDAMAAKLGVAASHIWEVLVARAYLEWIDAVAILVMLLALYPLQKMIYSIWAANFDKESGGGYNDWTKQDCRTVVLSVTAILVVFFGILGVLETVEAFKAGMAPEYWALNKLQYILRR
ncbi:MAG: hypothetical protein KOO63_07860 [Bacteroidales bacterium]|nr:hypothetical protein [Candidatus Latescibacterota bacterium]